MSDFENLQARAEAIVIGGGNEGLILPPDETAPITNSVEILNDLNSLAFKIALRLRINGNIPEIELLQHPPKKRNKEDLEVVGRGWVVDYEYLPTFANIDNGDFYLAGIYLDRGAGLYKFQGVKGKVDSGYPNGTLVLENEADNGLLALGMAEVSRADEIMLKLAVFAVSVGAKLN